jgi:hypothetical protein
MKQKTWLIVAVLIIVLATVGFFVLRGTPPAAASGSVRLEIEQGKVEIQPSGGGDWRAAEDGEELAPGTKIRTGAETRALVNFYDTSAARLAADTEITLDAFAMDPENEARQNVSISVDHGSIWSRILRLLDFGSTFEVKTSSTVSVVRGTAFGVAAGLNSAVEVWSGESVVSTTDTNTKERAITLPGFSTRLGARVKAATKKITDSQRARLAEQTARDRKFATEAMRTRLAKATEVTFGDQLRDWSSQDQTERERATRRAFDAALLRAARAARVGHAAEAKKILQEIVRQGELAQDPVTRAALRASLLAHRYVFAGTDDASPLAPERDAYDRLQVALADSSEQKLFYAEMLFEDRLETLRALRARGSPAADRLAERIGTQGTDLLELYNALSGDMKDSEVGRQLHDRLAYHTAILSGEAEDVAGITLEEASTSVDGVTEGGAPAPASPGEPTGETNAPSDTNSNVTVNTNTNAPTETARLTSLTVEVGSKTVGINGTATVKATAHLSDGSAKDRTTFATYTVTPAIGSVSNGVFHADNATGDAVITATYKEGDEVVSGSATVTVRNIVSNLEVSANQPSIGLNGTTVLHAIAVYSDGSRKEVAADCIWLSSVDLGTFDGVEFAAGSVAGATTMSAEYTDAGVTVRGSTVITVNGPSGSTNRNGN